MFLLIINDLIMYVSELLINDYVLSSVNIDNSV